MYCGTCSVKDASAARLNNGMWEGTGHVMWIEDGVLVRTPPTYTYMHRHSTRKEKYFNKQIYLYKSSRRNIHIHIHIHIVSSEQFLVVISSLFSGFFYFCQYTFFNNERMGMLLPFSLEFAIF